MKNILNTYNPLIKRKIEKNKRLDILSNFEVTTFIHIMVI